MEDSFFTSKANADKQMKIDMEKRREVAGANIAKTNDTAMFQGPSIQSALSSHDYPITSFNFNNISNSNLNQQVIVKKSPQNSDGMN